MERLTAIWFVVVMAICVLGIEIVVRPGFWVEWGFTASLLASSACACVAIYRLYRREPWKK